MRIGELAAETGISVRSPRYYEDQGLRLNASTVLVPQQCFDPGPGLGGAMPELIAPTRRLRDAWLEAHAEWGPGVHEDGFGLLETDEIDSPVRFDAWVARLANDSGHCTYRWIVDGRRVLGGIALRHESHELVARAGHIGFGIRPSARRRGLAGWALGRMLGEAKELGMDRVLIMCEAGNIASARTIQSRGGTPAELGNAADDSAWRYWIEL